MSTEALPSFAGGAGEQDIDVKLPLSEVHARLDALSSLANLRMAECDPMLVGLRGGAAIDFMTGEERAERHRLMLMLPTFAEQREAAQLRIQARIAERKAARERRLNTQN